MTDYLKDLNDPQRAAVTYLGGPELVIAGAGSGKTRVLTYKIVHLLAKGYEPWRLLALTFTNKAAREMRERITTSVGWRTASRLWMGTFHSVFLKFLRYHADLVNFPKNFTIYDAADSKSLIKMIIKDMNLDDKIYKPSTVQNEISAAKNALISPEAYASDKDLVRADRDAMRPRMAEIYAAYCARCRIAGAMDFDDLLFYTYVILRDNPEILNHYREYFSYVLVDEYQDTNYAQHVIVEMLCRDGNLCVVGDDAQSIYSFRGANIRNILGLKKTFPSLETFKLEQNYRSTQNIINAANSLIAKNRDQIQKNVFTANEAGDRVQVVKCYSDIDEAATLADSILRRKMKTGDNYGDFAVLYRTNAQSRTLEESLRRRNIPYRIYGGLAFYQRKEIKDAVSYFRLAANPDDDEALKRVINTPARGIGATTVQKLAAAALKHSKSIFTVLTDPVAFGADVNKGTASKLSVFKKLIDSFIKLAATHDAAQTATRIIAATNMLTSLLTEKTPENISRQENLRELLSAAQQFVDDSREEFGDEADVSINAFLVHIFLAIDQEDNEKVWEEEKFPAGKITLMTIHAAKGLEFNNVFIVGVEDNILPSEMSKSSPAQVEEERRLLYVALTRARHFCMMSYVRERFRNGTKTQQRPSPFLNDIDSRWLHCLGGADLRPGNTYRPTGYEEFRRTFNATSRSVLSPTGGHPKKKETISSFRAQSPSSVPQATSGLSNADSPEFCIRPVEAMSKGMQVIHQRFGRGEITDVDAETEKITVDFGSSGMKTLLLKYALLHIC